MKALRPEELPAPMDRRLTTLVLGLLVVLAVSFYLQRQQNLQAEALRSQAQVQRPQVPRPQDMAAGGERGVPAAALPAGPARCQDNLCGLDSYCSCHGAAAARRCWATQQRCEQDAACCAARGGCKGTTAGEDACSRQVRALEVPHG